MKDLLWDCTRQLVALPDCVRGPQEEREEARGGGKG
jgi:hypothetical protein